MAIGGAGARALFMSGLRKIGYEQIADDGADIETHRPDKGKFRIDDARIQRRHHDRAGMEIAMDHGLG